MTLDSFRKHLAQEVKALGSQRNLAKKYGVSPMFICDILSGRRDPGEKLLSAMGFERTVVITRRVDIRKSA
jgi:hypothetical protein